jgi:hypothetical protein
MSRSGLTMTAREVRHRPAPAEGRTEVLRYERAEKPERLGAGTIRTELLRHEATKNPRAPFGARGSNLPSTNQSEI